MTPRSYHPQENAHPDRTWAHLLERMGAAHPGVRLERIPTAPGRAYVHARATLPPHTSQAEAQSVRQLARSVEIETLGTPIALELHQEETP